jgi:hypothetical protein
MPPKGLHDGSYQQPSGASDASADRLTLVAIAIVAYVLANVLHEGVGHGGACLLVGGRPLALSSVHFQCDDEARLVAAGGTLVNLAAGAISWALLRLASRAAVHVRYFLWLAMTVNLLQGGGYFLFSGVGHFGDWAAVIRGLQPPWAWTIGLVVLGVVSYLLMIWLSLLEMRQFLPRGAMDRARHAGRLALTPYLAGGILSCIAGMFNPVGVVLVAVSAAAATFGGTSALAWMTQLLSGKLIPERAYDPVGPVARNWGWVAAGGLLAMAYVVVLGPGIRFH